MSHLKDLFNKFDADLYALEEEAFIAIEEKDKRIQELEAKIDSLMLEYCPEEMTQDQIDNWVEHQVGADNE